MEVTAMRHHETFFEQVPLEVVEMILHDPAMRARTQQDPPPAPPAAAVKLESATESKIQNEQPAGQTKEPR
jgi:hypothetical protein